MMSLVITNKTASGGVVRCSEFQYPEIQYDKTSFQFIDADFMCCGGYVLAPGDEWEWSGKSSLKYPTYRKSA